MSLPISYNLRNILRRKLSTTLTFIVVGAVVLVLSVLLSFAAGIHASLAASGLSRNLIVLKPGATAESTSVILPEEVGRVVQTPGIARDDLGNPLISKELCVQTSIPRNGNDGRLANVMVRGVDEEAFHVHAEVTLITGRVMQTGQREIVVGRAASERYANLNLGDELSLGRLENRTFRVVGVFEAAGGSLESEIWAPRTLLEDAYNRRFLSSVVVQLEDQGLAPAAIEYLQSPAVQLEAKTEPDYYEELSTKTKEVVILTTILVSIMAVGAIFAVANTMFAAVDGRRREIAMLRTLGFSRGSIVASFVMESLLICAGACAAGLGLSLFVHGSRQDVLSETTWTVLAYDLTITPGIVAVSFTAAMVVGVAGALAPAVRAARMNVIAALRKA